MLNHDQVSEALWFAIVMMAKKVRYHHRQYYGMHDAARRDRWLEHDKIKADLLAKFAEILYEKGIIFRNGENFAVLHELRDHLADEFGRYLAKQRN